MSHGFRGGNTGIVFRMSHSDGSDSVRNWTFPLWQRMALFGVGYFLTAETAGFLSPRNLPFVSFWMPAGLSVAVLLMNPTRDWPWLLLAILPANFLFDSLHGTEIPVILGFYCANAVEYLAGAWLVRTFVAERPELKTLREFIGLVVLGAVINSAIGAVIGAGTLVHFGATHSFGLSWRTWWGSNMMAIMVLAPFILAWFCPLHSRHRETDSPRRTVEALLLLAGTTGALWNLLASDQGVLSPDRVFLVPFILWAGLRFGVRGATAVCLIIALGLSFFSTQAFSRVARDWWPRRIHLLLRRRSWAWRR